MFPQHCAATRVRDAFAKRDTLDTFGIDNVPSDAVTS